MDTLLIIIVVFLVGWCAFLSIRLARITNLFERISKVSDGPLSVTLIKLLKSYESSKSEFASIYKELARIDREKANALQRLGVVRYNVAGEGVQSFSLAVLDASGSGFVISSLVFDSDHKTYLKTISHARSDAKLSNEEKEAIKIALSQKI